MIITPLTSWIPNSITNDVNITDGVSENLDHNFSKLWQSDVDRTIISIWINICSHNFNNKREKKHENGKNDEEWNQVSEHRDDHLNQESEVVNNSDVLERFQDGAQDTNDCDKVVQEIFSFGLHDEVITLVIKEDVISINERHGEVIKVPAWEICFKLIHSKLSDLSKLQDPEDKLCESSNDESASPDVCIIDEQTNT